MARVPFHCLLSTLWAADCPSNAPIELLSKRTDRVGVGLDSSFVSVDELLPLPRLHQLQSFTGHAIYPATEPDDLVLQGQARFVQHVTASKRVTLLLATTPN